MDHGKTVPANQNNRGHELDHGKKVPANQNNGNSEDEIEDRNMGIIDNPDGTFLDNFPRIKNLFEKDKDNKSRKMLADVDFLIHYSTPRGLTMIYIA